METKLLIADSATDSNMFYAARTVIDDDFIYLDKNGQKIIYVDSSWINSAKQEANVDKVINYSEYDKDANRNFLNNAIRLILKENKIKKVFVPENFKVKYAKVLTDNKIKFEIKKPFFENRESKSRAEVANIKLAQKAVENAALKVISIIKKSTAGKDGKLELEGKILTRYFLERAAIIELINNGYESPFGCMIFNSTDLFEENKEGLLFEGNPIIIDIFPKSSSNRYFSDMTRTVVKGKASPEIKKIYDTVLAAQELAIEKARPGLKGKELYKIVLDYFAKCGYKTTREGNVAQGFTHGLGHGVGLDVHETPELNLSSEDVLKDGNIITIEPGLYYSKIGGVRIEDILLINKTGNENLTRFPKYLEV